MGFGLHFGWAVEGAIGSALKVDASYLSPHVNMASRMEAATKQYGVDLLFSGAFYELLPTHVARLCRHIDRVKVKGSNVVRVSVPPPHFRADSCLLSPSPAPCVAPLRTDPPPPPARRRLHLRPPPPPHAFPSFRRRNKGGGLSHVLVPLPPPTTIKNETN
jgi:hypothetical protein